MDISGSRQFAVMGRLWEHVDQRMPDQCWEWTGTRTPAGYGVVYGYRGGRSERVAHRLAYVFFNGPIPDGHHVHHVCRNPACCNPFHLRVLDANAHARHHGAPGGRCHQGHPKTPANTGKYGQCLTCRDEFERRRRATPERKEQVAAAGRRRLEDPERRAKIRARQREWAARKRATDPEFAERERAAAREYQRRKRLEGLVT